MAIAVIGGALLRIAQNTVRFGRFFEFFFRLKVAVVAVGVVLHRELPVSSLQHLLVAIPGDAQDLVIIAFRHVHFEDGWTATFTIAGLSRRPLKLYPR